MSEKNNVKSVLFVCLGNICRSPAGEGVLQKMLNDRGLSTEIMVDSAGTGSYHIGEQADRRMREHAARRGYELKSRARQITPSDLEQFDLVIAMDRENVKNIDLVHRQATAEIKLLGEFLEGNWPPDVPDPYTCGEQGFEHVLDMVEGACPKIIEYLSR